MAEQLVFNLPCRTARGRDDFFVSPANAGVLAIVDNWHGWIDGKLVLTGPRGAGKTHLASVWAEATGARMVDAGDLANEAVPGLAATGAVCVEDVDRLAALGGEAQKKAEQALFHLHNFLRSGGGALLITGRDAAARWDISLPDLASRLRSAQTAALPPPDDQLLAAVLVKLFEDRQIAVSPELIRFLIERMERSLNAAARLVDRLDRAAMQRKRAVSKALASEVLGAGG